MKLFKKYEFDSQEQAEAKIDALPSQVIDDIKYPAHNHAIVKLGFIVIEKGQYDDELNEIKAPVFSNKYSVDVLWDNLTESPYGWKSYEITVEGNGVHTFAGLNF